MKDVLKSASVALVLGLLLSTAARTWSASDRADPSSEQSKPLILERDEGERRVRRIQGGTPFILKVDAKNGGSHHFVLATEDVPPGNIIHKHIHPHADEILILQTGTAKVWLGNEVKVAHAGGIVFIPANTLISVQNIGSDSISLIFIFSEVGFEDYLRAVSVPEGQPVPPLTTAEREVIRKAYGHDVVFEDIR